MGLLGKGNGGRGGRYEMELGWGVLDLKVFACFWKRRLGEEIRGWIVFSWRSLLQI